MPWEIEFTAEAEQWFHDLPPLKAAQVTKAFDLLEEHGPGLGRRTVDSIKGARHHNMKELRSFGRYQRALFAFDPRRTAVVLVAGDKQGDWTGFYKRAIPLADRLFDDHLRELRDGLHGRQRQPRAAVQEPPTAAKGKHRWPEIRAGRQSAGREI